MAVGILIKCRYRSCEVAGTLLCSVCLLPSVVPDSSRVGSLSRGLNQPSHLLQTCPLAPFVRQSLECICPLSPVGKGRLTFVPIVFAFARSGLNLILDKSGL